MTMLPFTVRRGGAHRRRGRRIPAVLLSVCTVLSVLTFWSAATGSPQAAESGPTSNGAPVGLASTPAGDGYWLAASDGGVFSFGAARFHGSMGGTRLPAPVVAITPTPADGYWLVAADGGVFAFGDAGFHGAATGQRLAAPVVGIAATPSGEGYWLAAADGGVFAYGDAQFHGAMAGRPLAAPVVGITAAPTGSGYWLVAADGGVFAFGDARFHGAATDLALNAAVVGIAATPAGSGYWLVAADGGVFAYGDARFHGSMADRPLVRPMTGIAATHGGGYRTVARDGGVFAFGDAGYAGRVVYSGPDPRSAPVEAAVTADLLATVFGARSATISEGLPSLNAAMRRAGITSPPRIAAFLATLRTESGFRYNALEGGCTAATRVYHPYCGRGYIQLTHRTNYRAAGAHFGHDFETRPEDARTLEFSAPIATWFWTVTHDLNRLADALDMNAITRAVNGPAAPRATLRDRCTDFTKVLDYYYGDRSVSGPVHCG